MDAPLVELVEHDDVEVAEQRIALQPRREDAFRRHEQVRRRREAALEADLPADLLADRPAALVRDASGQRARRDTPRLQQDRAAERGRAPAGCASSCPSRAARRPRRVRARTDVGDDRGRHAGRSGAAFAPESALWRRNATTTTTSTTRSKAPLRHTRKTIRRTPAMTKPPTAAPALWSPGRAGRRLRHHRRRHVQPRHARGRTAGDRDGEGEGETKGRAEAGAGAETGRVRSPRPSRPFFQPLPSAPRAAPSAVELGQQLAVLHVLRLGHFRFITNAPPGSRTHARRSCNPVEALAAHDGLQLRRR